MQIDVPEKLDIDDRAGFYDATGAVLDMLVTHLFQVAAEVAMEPPASLGADDLQAAREEVIALLPAAGPGRGGARPVRRLPGRRGVARPIRPPTPSSRPGCGSTTTRWQGVPFLLRTGKRMARQPAAGEPVFRRPRGPLTNIPPDGAVLSFDLSGDGEIDIAMTVKKPGPDESLSVGHLSLLLDTVPQGHPLAPYPRLVLDVLDGDRSLFTRPDGLAHVWEVAAPLLNHPPAVRTYPVGSMGPPEADGLGSPCGWLVWE